jgi:hypothetical protein
LIDGFDGMDPAMVDVVRDGVEQARCISSSLQTETKPFHDPKCTFINGRATIEESEDIER